MPNHILEYQLSTPENVNVVQMTNFTEKKRKSFFDPRDKMKYPKPFISKRHSQSFPRVSFAYSMKCRQSTSDNNFTKNVIFWLLIDPCGKHENSKNLLRICKTCAIRS